MRSHLKTALLFAVVALLLLWFARNLDWQAVAANLRAADRRMIAVGVCLVWSTYLLRALRWRTFLRPFAAVNLPDLFAATTVGFSAIFLIGRAGELVRPAFLSLRDSRVRPAASFMTVAVERVCDMAAIALMFATALMFVRAAGGDEAASARFAAMRQAGFLMLAVAVVGIICLAVSRRFAPAIIGWAESRLTTNAGFTARVGKLFTGVLQQLTDALGVFTDGRALAATVVWTAVLWAVIVLVYLIVLNAFGIPVHIAETVFVMGCSLVGSLVPTPGGAAGTYHAATAGGLALLGVADERAVAAAFVLHLVVWSPALVFGIYYFLRSGVRFNRLREVAAHRDDDAAPPASATRTTTHVAGETGL